MRFDLSSQNTKILQEQKKHRQWMAAFLVLSVTVVLGTAAALKLYGQALTHKVKVLDCQVKAHEHTDECYVYDEEKGEDVPVCGYADYLVHVHNDDCYDENGRLVCPLEEIKPHKHTDECYEEQRVLVCGLEGIEPAQAGDTDAAGTAGSQPGQTPGGGAESQPVKTTEAESQPEQTSGAQSQPAQETTAEAPSTEAPTTAAPAEASAETETRLVCAEKEHTHTDACYGEAALTCTLEEHKHGDECYETALSCETPEHVHESGCYDENGELICGFEEHEHGEACYEKTLTCTKVEHEHEDACYGERELTCKEKEHTHTDACYAQAAVETKAPAETKAPETKAPETKAPETKAAETTAAPTTAAPETTTAAGEGVHVHTDACYETRLVPVCGKLELHTHDEDCYDEDGKLICELPQLEEHVHDKDCFKTVELTDEEIAALNAGAKLHIHHEDCYDENGELICGHNETHIHGEKCYDRDGKLICGHDEAHVHTPDCYDKNGDIICGLEVVLHEHTDACYDENGKLICDHAHIHEESCFDEDGNMTCDFEDVGDYLWTCENEEENYIVTAKFNYEAKIPGNAKLIAEQIKPEGDDEEYFAQREKEYREAMQDETADMRALMRIGFYVENKDAKNEKDKLTEIEPEAPVTITVQFLDDDGLADGEPITVVHFGKEGTELLDGGQAEDNSTTFEMKGFSDIAIGYGDEGAKAAEDGSLSGGNINIADKDANATDKKEETIHLDDSFEYDAAPFHIVFHVKGEAKGADGQILIPEQPEADAGLPEEDLSALPDAGEEAEDPAQSGSDKSDEENADIPEVKENDGETTDSSETEEKGGETASSPEVKEDSDETSSSPEAEVNGENPAQFEEEEEAAPAVGEDDTVEQNPGDGEKVDSEEKEEVKEKADDETAADTEEKFDKEKLELNVESLEDDPMLNEAVTDYLGESTETIQRRVLYMFRYDVAYDGVELDLSDCEVTAEVTLNQDTQEAQEYLASVTGNNDAGIATVADTDNAETEDTAADEETAEASSVDATLMVLSVSEDRQQVKKLSKIDLTGPDATDGTDVFEADNNIMALADESTSDPIFTVQYYAYAQIMAEEDDVAQGTPAIEIIDTCKKANVYDQAELPRNSAKNVLPKTKKMFIKQNGSKHYDNPQQGGNDWAIYEPVYKSREANSTASLTKLYLSDQYDFKEVESGGLNNINKFAKDGLNFDLYEVWVLQDKSKLDSTTKDGWKVYGEEQLKELKFFNSGVTDGSDTAIVITDDTVIRLVGKSNTKNHNYPARFFDYDYMGYENNKASKILKGINSPSNYTPSLQTDNNGNAKGAVYGFGNFTSGKTGLEDSKIDGTNYTINRANWPGEDARIIKKCSFGLVQSALSETGYPQFVVNAPDLFSPQKKDDMQKVKGKTEISGRSLNFERDGDTYTLVSVEGSGDNAKNLNQFQCGGKAYKGGGDIIYTNQFWPMDNAPTFGASGHDPKFGKETNINGVQVALSDDGELHNYFFGMAFEVEFELTEDYVGPLNYYFFGDDDMWVFLEYPEGEKGTNGQSTQLICDIGGVHQAAGEYVDLWNYIKKPENGNTTVDPGTNKKGDTVRPIKKYKLKFFYTERGASGSTCWMQFTLPSVNAVPVIDYTGNVQSTLTLNKKVDGAPTDRRFDFTIEFEGGENSNVALNTHPYEIYYSNGEVKKGDIRSGDIFKLGHGDTIKVFNLPDNTGYVIREINSDGYEPGLDSGSVGGTIEANKTVTGNIDWDRDDILNYINKEIPYNLPETGGPGTNLYTMAGALCLMFGAGLMYRKKYRGRRV